MSREEDEIIVVPKRELDEKEESRIHELNIEEAGKAQINAVMEMADAAVMAV